MRKTSLWALVVLAAVTVKQLIFVWVIPPWQVPDEPAHVAYVQTLVEDKRWPVFSTERMDVSKEMLTSLTRIENLNPQRIGRHYPPGFLDHPSQGGDRVVRPGEAARNLAARNSPLYYSYVATGYLLAGAGDLETRVLTMRFFSAVLVLVVVWLAMAIARTFSNHRFLYLSIGVIVGFHPAISLIFAGVNPDTLLTLAATWALWLMVTKPTGSIVRRGLLIALSVGIAASIKPPGWFLILPAGVWISRQWSRLSRPMFWRLTILGALIIGFFGAGWLIIQSTQSTTDVVQVQANNAQPLSWERVLQNDLFERPTIVWRTFWGHVGWSGVSKYAPEWFYVTTIIIHIAAWVGAVRGFTRSKSWRSWPVWIFISSAISLEGLYQWLYWQSGLTTGAHSFPVHGRYYLPLIVPVATLILFGLLELLPRRFHTIAAGWVAALVVGSSIITLATVNSLYQYEGLRW